MSGEIKPPFFNPPLLGSVNDNLLTAGVTGVGFGEGNLGVKGNGQRGDGVEGTTELGGKHGVVGRNQTSGALGFLGGSDPVFGQHAGVYGESNQQGVMGLSNSASGTGVYGGNTANGGGAGIGVRGETSSGVGVQGQSFGEGLAGNFIGNVNITGSLDAGHINASGNINAAQNITAFDVVLSGADCAEDFDIAGIDAVVPGTVMVIDSEGTLRPCECAYDKKVTGVISGAGAYKPGIVLDKRQSAANRLPLALVGKVYCKVDAKFGSIEVGDLLTTSPTPGHGMKADDPLKAFGSVIGKALRPLKDGQGLIPILIALQ